MATKKTAKKAGKGKKQSNAMLAAEIGAGVLAAGAAAGAAYYFYGDKKAKKHRQAAAKWAKGMKAQVIKEAKVVAKLDQKAMAAIVDKAAAAYAGVRSVDANDLRQAAAELKRNWKEIEREVASARSKAKSTGKKVAKKATKAVNKAAKAVVKKTTPKKAAKKASKKR